jgi:hypothetical protein
MQQPTEQVAAMHLGSIIPADDGQLSGSVRCLKSEGAVWTMSVVVLGVDAQDVLQVPSADDGGVAGMVHLCWMVAHA